MKLIILFLIFIDSTFSFQLDNLASSLTNPKVSLTECKSNLSTYRTIGAKKELITTALSADSIAKFVKAVTNSRHVNYKQKENDKVIKCIESRDKNNICLNEINSKMRQCRFVGISNNIISEYVKYSLENKPFKNFDFNNEMHTLFRNITSDNDAINKMSKYLDSGIKKDLKISRISPVNIIHLLIYSVNNKLTVYNWLNYADLFSCMMIKDQNCLKKWIEIVEFRSDVFYLLEDVYYYFYKKVTISK